jgi:hypothetical protein
MSNPEAPMQRPLVQLPNGVILNLDHIRFIGRKELNQFVVFFDGPQGPIISGEDLDLLQEFGIVQVLKTAKKEATKVEEKLVVEA